MITAIVLIAIFIPIVWYFYLAYKIHGQIRSLADFFPLTRFVKGDEYGRSTAAAGVSLATVILALINLAPFLGLGLLVTIGSYIASFILLYFCASRILEANPQNETLQGFIGRMFKSHRLKFVAVLFSFVGYVSIFSMELLVGATVLEPIFGKNVIFFSVLYLVFILGYSCLGGFKAIVATEQWQIRFVVIAVVALLAMIPLLASDANTTVNLLSLTNSVIASSTTPIVFAIGIIAMNIPAAISDSGTWQRLCATNSVQDAKAGIRKAIPMFALIWGSLILGACYVSQLAVSTGMFDPTKSSLMSFIVSTLATSSIVHIAILFVFMMGLFAAMITTADSLLLVAAQMFSIDVLRIAERSGSNVSKLRKARLLLCAIATLSFLLFLVFKLSGFDVVQLIFSIYGSNLALFPVVIAALFFAEKMDLQRSTFAAIASVMAGFCLAWTSAIYGKLSGNLDWLYYAPVVALLSSSIIFLTLTVAKWHKSNSH